jgi:hypothetical protein
MSLRVLVVLALLGAAVVSAGCGSDDSETPGACLVDAETYVSALRSAPEEVRLEGETPISDCLTSGQQGGELSQAGGAMVEAATQLNQAARRDPGGNETVQLGYLVGAVQEGASDTGGIHTDLVRRLDDAARFSPGGAEFTVEFEQAFGAGYAAGQESG